MDVATTKTARLPKATQAGSSNGHGPAAPASAIALVDRLLKVEERVQRLEHDNAKLRRQAAAADSNPASGASFFDVPKTKFEWKLADNETLSPDDLGLYDIRCDDAVVLTGREGQHFLAAFSLLSEAPDYAGAVMAINAIEAGLGNSAAPLAAPDVSIVIPVYGQLAYTLNCIHSLRAHKSRYSAEIIIIDDASPDVSAAYLPDVECIRFHKQPKNGGFIESCNTGGRLARGKFIIMLNNDTRVVPGWLDELIGGFDLWPNAGLVGSKLHYADGTLQEAGGIIWRDGSAWNYGRNDDPNRPQYSYARQVDYISGCSIALRTELWRELDGFNRHYHPAYCEDSDLALRVKAGGREVWMQPLSRIVHYEGKTSGTDTATGAKAYQIVNTKKMFLQWRDMLSTHRRNAEAPYLERERAVSKRFLVVDVTTPTPDQDAGSVQTFMALQVCQGLGYKAHFVPEDNWLFQPKYTSALQRFGVDCAYAPYELGFDAYLRRYGWQFDAIMVYRAGVMEKALPVIRRFAPQAAVLFHVADLHYLRLERTAELTGDTEILATAAAMKTREMDLVASVDCTVTHSSAEQEILAREAPDSPVVLWPLMFEFFGTTKSFAARRDICFLGGYRHTPNIDAVLYFIQEIFPLIKAREPDIRFIIAGAHPPEEIRQLDREDIIVAGMIGDLRDLFDACRVFVCPLRVGAGAKGKVVSALSYGIPIVSTAVGVEGAGLTSGETVLVADDPASFAADTLRLYRDEALWTQLSRAGQQAVRENFSRGMGERVLSHAIDTAFAKKLGLPLPVQPAP